MTMQKIDLNKYSEFVAAVTSEESNETPKMISRIQELEEQGCHVSLLLTSALGLSAEAGEFTDIVKKILFQGKKFNDEIHYLMIKELGDVCWYLMNAARALDIDPNEIFFENVRKLEVRYPGGKFSAAQSENRKEGDL